tara:strand:+ start:9633 stop:9890 length:258 start_codon:yes stop_codon:yes gene_type:complete
MSNNKPSIYNILFPFSDQLDLFNKYVIIYYFKTHKPEIIWVNKVHEQILGCNNYAKLPADDDSYDLYHIKNVYRQRQQNLSYSII